MIRIMKYLLDHTVGSSHPKSSSSIRILISSGIANAGCVSLIWMTTCSGKEFRSSILLYVSWSSTASLQMPENKTVLNAAFYPAYDHLTDIRLSRLLLQCLVCHRFIIDPSLNEWKSNRRLLLALHRRRVAGVLVFVSNDRYIIWDCNDGIIIFMFNL